MSSSQPWCRLALFLLLFLPVFLLVRPSSASGQIRPGIERGDYWATVRAQYRSEVLEEVGDLMENWITAWNNYDAESITEIFAEDGVLILDETRSAGGSSDVTGHLVWILIKHDGGWKIRSQIFQRSRE